VKVSKVSSQGTHNIDISFGKKFWLPILGPTSFLLFETLSQICDSTDSKYCYLSLTTVAEQLGISYKKGKNSPMARSLERLANFKLININDYDISLVDGWPNLTHKQLKKLPTHVKPSSRDGFFV